MPEGSELPARAALQSGPMQRAQGLGRFSAKPGAARTMLDTLHQQGAAKLRFPKPVPGSNILEAIVINTAGGMTGGDRFKWDITAGANTNVSVTTQANEKVYKASSGTAEVDIRLELKEGARLSWLPQETILFDRSALSRHLDVSMQAGSELLLCEAIVFGRHGHGEQLVTGSLRDRWRIRMGDRLVHAEELSLEGAIRDVLSRKAVADGAGAIATLIAIGGDSHLKLEAARQIIKGEAEISGGASLIEVGATPGLEKSGTGKLLARLIAKDGYLLRKALIPLVGLLNGKAGLPKSWSL